MSYFVPFVHQERRSTRFVPCSYFKIAQSYASSGSMSVRNRKEKQAVAMVEIKKFEKKSVRKMVCL